MAETAIHTSSTWLLHVIDHMMVRGPRAQQTPLELRSVCIPMTRNSYDAALRNIFCSANNMASPSHRRGHRQRAGLSCCTWLVHNTIMARSDSPLFWIADRLSATWYGGRVHAITEPHRFGESGHWIGVATPLRGQQLPKCLQFDEHVFS